MAKILKGKDVADKITANLIERCESLKSKGIVPVLAILRVGENPSDLAYERGATNRGEKVGIEIRKTIIDESATTEEVIEKIEVLNKDESVHGVLIFRPLPGDIADDRVRNALAREKDVDGIGDEAMAGVYGGKDLGYPPCTAAACIEILKQNNIDIQGSKAVVIGRSLVIGRPVAMMLMRENATVTICHTKTKDMGTITRDADIIIASAGKINALTEDMVSEKQVVLDVGINVDEEGNLKGDVDFEKVKNLVHAITPVPGGVGSVTTSILMKHVIEAAEKTSQN